jgi:DNA-directed RNA polymerase specialized sigma subunit
MPSTFTPAKLDDSFSAPTNRLEPKFAPAFHAWSANPNPTSSDAFLKAVDPVIQEGLNVYGGRSANPMMRSRARRIALQAAGRYDPSKASLKTHLMAHLQGLRRYGAQQNQVIHVPEAVALDQHHLNEAEAELSDRLGRDPSDLELADHTGLSRRRIAHIRGYRSPVSEGRLALLADEDEEGGAGGGFEPAVEGPDRTKLRAEFLYHDLDPHDQVILEYGMGLNGATKLPASQIARRLKLSPGAVSQRAARIQQMLDEFEDSALL